MYNTELRNVWSIFKNTQLDFHFQFRLELHMTQSQLSSELFDTLSFSCFLLIMATNTQLNSTMKYEDDIACWETLVSILSKKNWV